MKKLKVGLFGATGRMGKEISKIISESPGLDLFLSLNTQTACDPDQAKQVDVWIDFSTPEALNVNLKIAVENKTPFVCGTTGFSKKEDDLLASAAQKIPILWSSNMSVGVAVLNEALKIFASLKDFDFQIEELHHIHKKDRPSGTAITLQKNLQSAVGRTIPEPVSIRGGGIFGIHKVFAMSPDETITFEHTALNRSVFARGAVQAAEWISSQKPGLYSMKDCLFGKAP
jgi:4-hydroxy-tetrahydrodipicolinate reductase